jgi:diguanylate cyclase (GGDEF)-like protein
LSRILLRLCLLAAFWAALLASQPCSAEAAAGRTKKAVLLLFPFQMDMLGSEQVVAAAREEFAAATDLESELFFEFLDLRRFPAPEATDHYFKLLASRYGDRRVDLVIVQSPRLLDLWLAQRPQIAPSAPVVAFDSSALDRKAQVYPADVLIMEGEYDFARSVEWLRQVRPQTREIVVVHGVGADDQRSLVHSALLKRQLQGKVRISELSQPSWPAILQQVAQLPATSAVLYFPLFQDAAGHFHRPDQALSQLAAASSVPVLTEFDSLMGTGAIGGYMYSLAQQSRAAARLGLRLMRGEPLAGLGQKIDAGNQFVFDHKVLQRFGIPLSALPADSHVYNRQFTAWETHRQTILAIAAVIAVLLGLVAVLAVALRRLRVARASLNRNNLVLEARVRERTAELELLARTDPLTGLANRRAFMETGSRELARARRYRSELALLMIDIDHFKAINDTHGHHNGDLVLNSLAAVSRATLREIDLPSRLGGEEFAVLLPQTSCAQAAIAAERLRAALAADRVVLPNGSVIQYTVSIGISCLGEQTADLESLLTQSDRALYQAKRGGRNRVALCAVEAVCAAA